MKDKHQKLLANLHGKEKIRVIFLVIHYNVWKVDSVFKRMLEDPYFEPEILICPYVRYGVERMQKDMDQAYHYFKDKNYPVQKSRRDDGSWIKLEEMSPDLVFFTNPYQLTIDEYYTAAYSNYLSCYVPYYFMATKHAGNESDVYNNILFLKAWKVYWPHEYCELLHHQLSSNKGENGLTLGYPAMEYIYTKRNLPLSEGFWKTQSKPLKKIIFSPHHTIENAENSLSSFIDFGETIQALSIMYKDIIQWSFKPHPILKSKLYLHPFWGKEKTDNYYEYWAEQTYTQLDEGEYDDLFISSDAIVHDCSSFIVEYAFTGKPSLYLMNNNNLNGLLNEFGEGVIDVYKKARNAQEIEVFILSLITDIIKVDVESYKYLNEYIDKYYKEKLPSERIVEDIKKSLGVLSAE